MNPVLAYTAFLAAAIFALFRLVQLAFFTKRWKVVFLLRDGGRIDWLRFHRRKQAVKFIQNLLADEDPDKRPYCCGALIQRTDR